MGGGRRGSGAVAKAAQVPKTAAPPQTTAPSDKEGKNKSGRASLHTQLKKTKICMYHLRGACQYSTNCAFAHSCSELQATPDLAKTRLCKTFSQQGVCTDPECTFAHGEEELRSTNMFFKKTLCMWNEKGKCRNGDQCRFAHGLTELRNAGGVLPEKTKSSKDNGIAKANAGSAAAGATYNSVAAAHRKVEKQQAFDDQEQQQQLQHHMQEQLQELQLLCMKQRLEQQLQAAVAGRMAAESRDPVKIASEPMKVKSSLSDASLGGSVNTYDDQLKGQLSQLQQMISVLSLRCGQIQMQMDSSPTQDGWTPASL